MNEPGGFGPQRLGRTLKTIAGKALGKDGLAFGALLTDWPTIMGSRLAEQTGPLKLVFPAGRRENAVLHIRVSSAAALLVQHEEPQILERINAFMGWRAVARLKLVHAGPALPQKNYALRPLKRLDPVKEAELTAATAPVDDPELRAALERLGRALSG
ncbi:DUF721 domain-containing protein [Niveispirillum fermenti]|uniref:DUF721 domain-containing protein n=1 Tax=Niveispirillum fermenti TaxID=1233113 RepID=UPI003A8731D3